MTAVSAFRGFYAIPPGTKPTPCERCGQLIYWIDHRCKPKRKGEIGKLSHLPISIRNNVHASAPTETTWGQGFNHLSECLFPTPNADSFRRDT